MGTIEIDRGGRKLRVNTNGIFLGAYKENIRELVGKIFYDSGDKGLYLIKAVVERGGQQKLRCKSLLEDPKISVVSLESCQRDREIGQNT